MKDDSMRYECPTSDVHIVIFGKFCSYFTISYNVLTRLYSLYMTEKTLYLIYDFTKILRVADMWFWTVVWAL